MNRPIVYMCSVSNPGPYHYCRRKCCDFVISLVKYVLYLGGVRDLW